MLRTGATIDRFVIEGVLGVGGMAAVYKARHTELESLHALKVLTIGTPAIADRLLKEGRAQARLRHPNIVAVTDVLRFDGSLALVMEYVDGPSLHELLERRRLSLTEALTLFRGIVRGVGCAHRAGIIHRDLKPGNVLLQDSDIGLIPKVADFGLVKGIEGSHGPSTRSGVSMGTPEYMAPEQIRDASTVDARADLFSLGVLFYEMLTVRRPFDSADTLQLFNQIVSGRYAPPETHVPELPSEVSDIVRRLLLTDREARFQTCPEVLDDLDALSGPGMVVGSTLDGPTLNGGSVPARGGIPAVASRPVEVVPWTSFKLELVALGVFGVLSFVGVSATLVAGSAEADVSTVDEPVADVEPTEIDPPEDVPPEDVPPEEPPDEPVDDGVADAEPTEPKIERPPREPQEPQEPKEAPPTEPSGTDEVEEPKDPDQVKKPDINPWGADDKPPDPEEGVGTEDPPVEEPPVEAPLTGPTGTIRYSGQARAVVAVASDGTRYGLPSKVPVGEYQIRAIFAGDPVNAGEVSVGLNEVLDLKCDGLFMKCIK